MTTALARKSDTMALTPSSRARVAPLLATSAQLSVSRDRVWVPASLTPAQESDVRGALVEYERALTPATKDQFLARMVRLANHWKNERTAGQMQALFEDLHEDLGEFSDAHLAEAISQHRKAKHWWPKSSDLFPLLEALQARDREMYRRCRVLLGAEEPRYWERVKTTTKHGTPARYVEVSKAIDTIKDPRIRDAAKKLLERASKDEKQSQDNDVDKRRKTRR